MSGDETDRSPGSDPHDSDLEWRLHAMLGARAEQLDPQLHGPQLRASATQRPSTIRRVGPALAAVATVAAIAVGVAVATTGDPTPSRRPVQPGGVVVTSPSGPVAPSTSQSPPRTTPTATPTATPPQTSGRSLVLRSGQTIATSPAQSSSVTRRTVGPSGRASTVRPNRPSSRARPAASPTR